MKRGLAVVLAVVAVVIVGCSAGGPPSARVGQSPASITTSSPATAQPDASAKATTPRKPVATYTAGIVEWDVEAAVRVYLKREAPNVEVASVDDIRVARDSDGSYWASAWATPASADFDAQVVFLRKTGSRWNVTDYGSGIDGSELPKAVRSRLWSD